MKVVPLTPSEADLWDWTVDPMIEFWSDADEREHDGDSVYEDVITPAREGIGWITSDPSVARDMLYRIEEQMASMLEDDWYANRGTTLSRQKAIKSLARKIRAAFNLNEEE